MIIKEIISNDQGYITVTIFTVANDLEVDFVSIQEEELTFKLGPLVRIRDTQSIAAAYKYLMDATPITEVAVKDHVYDSPVKVDLWYDIMSADEVLSCIETL